MVEMNCEPMSPTPIVLGMRQGRPLSVVRKTARLAAGLFVAGVVSAQTPRPAWTRGAVCYEIFVRSFYDSNGDGIGDLTGIMQNLDYLHSLDIACIWLMPVAKSPSYH